ncbi:hypothetical protein EJ110_NYTH54691 [Nymphaea thermarum]|nr:hypothetical protein EJ110_NYTH54691 [Nymphaea thermarum]
MDNAELLLFLESLTKVDEAVQVLNLSKAKVESQNVLHCKFLSAEDFGSSLTPWTRRDQFNCSNLNWVHQAIDLETLDTIIKHLIDYFEGCEAQLLRLLCVHSVRVAIAYLFTASASSSSWAKKSRNAI